MKMIYKMDVQSSNCFHKISMLKNNGVNSYVGAYSAILSLWLNAPLSCLLSLFTRYMCIDKNNRLRIFMLSGSIQFHSFVSVKSNHAILLNNTFKSFWMIHVNTIHILISYSIIYGSLIIPNIHFHM